MQPPIVVLGVPTALGGQLGGMERTPSALRASGLLDRLRSRPGIAGSEIRDAGDLVIRPGVRDDPDRRAKNRRPIAEFLPRERDLVADSLADAGPRARLLVVGGDCTVHAGAMAGLRLVRPEARLAVAWFDAHGDFNTPDTTPSGNVWGMPFAMACGIGEPELVAACDGPSVAAREAALLGGQVLDETESRMLVAEGVAHFGSGMLQAEAGMAALAGWAAALALEVDAIYVAVDHDVLDASGDWAVQMPEPDGLPLETAVRAVRTLADAVPVIGFGATGINVAGGDVPKTLEALVSLAEAALAAPAGGSR